jgi:hypothetical protein
LSAWRSAVVCNEATSEPASGSVIAKAAIASPLATLRQIAALFVLRSRKRDRITAQRLQRKHGIGERIAARQLLAQNAQNARLDLLASAAELTRHGALQKSCCAEFLNQTSRALLNISFASCPRDKLLFHPQSGLVLGAQE